MKFKHNYALVQEAAEAFRKACLEYAPFSSPYLPKDAHIAAKEKKRDDAQRTLAQAVADYLVVLFCGNGYILVDRRGPKVGARNYRLDFSKDDWKFWLEIDPDPYRSSGRPLEIRVSFERSARHKRGAVSAAALQAILNKANAVADYRIASAKATEAREVSEKEAAARMAEDFAGFEMPVNYAVQPVIGKLGFYVIEMGRHGFSLPGFHGVDAQAVKDLLTSMRRIVKEQHERNVANQKA